MNLREAKSLEIAAKFRLIFDKGVWLVPSQSSSAVYRVSLAPDNSTCTCEDFNLRAEPCKHILAARLVQARDYGGKAPAIDTDVLPKKKTYKQNWPAYDEAQTTEKHRFQILLHDICRGLTEPSRPSKGRHGHTLRDTVFAAAFKVYTTFSSRRFSCDLLDAHTRGYVSRPIPGRKVNSFLEDEALTSVLHDLIVQSSLPLRTVETTFAPDSSGFSTSRFIRWYDEKYGHERSGRDWIKCHVLTGTKTNIVTAVRIEGRDAGHSPQFKPLLEKTAENFTIREVPADKAYLSRENLELVESLGGTAYIPFKVNSVAGDGGDLWAKMFGFYQFKREEFLARYHQRSKVESTFSMVNAKFGDAVRSKTDVAMKNEVLCKFLCHNIVVIHQSHRELGIAPVFWEDEQQGDEPVVLRLARNSAT